MSREPRPYHGSRAPDHGRWHDGMSGRTLLDAVMQRRRSSPQRRAGGVPRDPAVDGTVGLLREGYAFIGNRCDRLRTDVFETRLLGARTLCMRGAAAARLLYDVTRMQREAAMPRRVQSTLTGRGGVQGLDGEAHRLRKAMFMSLMTAERIAALVAATTSEWRRATAGRAGERIVLFDRAEEVLCRAVCAWSGVPLAEQDVARRAADFNAMIGGGGALGPRHWRARRARARAERWIAALVEQARDDRVPTDEAGALSVIATHCDDAGRSLTPRIAAVEILNVLRPTVAVATYVTFAALALHEHPSARDAVASGEPGLDRFVHEVRRFYPFFPFVAARARESFEWREHRIPEGRRVLLDLYATNRYAQVWGDPDVFRPDRFIGVKPGPYEFVPQGGGDHFADHRCAGEWITIELMKAAVRYLSEELAYRVPEQDLSVSLRRMPTLPRSRFVVELTR